VITSDEYATLRELYESIKDDDSVGYKTFLQKLHRVEQGNPRAMNKLRARLGLAPHIGRQSEFVAYDSEGWDNKIVLLANSLGENINNVDGLTTAECFDFLTHGYTKTVKRIFFSFSYDINHFLTDLDPLDIERLLTKGWTRWEKYKISYIPGKIFSINNYKYYDVFGFFQTSFINAVTKLLGDDAVTDVLLRGKEARGAFDEWGMDALIEYNAEELRLLTQMMDRLKQAFLKIDAGITEWYGPGAVAKYWYKKHKLYPRDDLNEGSLVALDRAYYGGRFEQISLGTIKNVYEYDINSAYPAVMSRMPYFLDWKRTKTYEPNPYSIWHVSFDLSYSITDDQFYRSFYPLPMRSHDGRICFPIAGRGWYWQSEIQLVRDFFPNARITIDDGYVANTEGLPFEWVEPLYDYRQSLKTAGDKITEHALKLGLNSLYGKTAQRVGSNDFFSLAWAGYITSTARSKLARAGFENGRHNIIGFATDALFSKTELDLPISKALGDWSAASFDSGLFVQSGVYRLYESNGEHQDRYRGSPLRKGIDDIIEQITQRPNNYPVVKVGRFISHLLAIKSPTIYGPHKLEFVQVQHQLNLDAPYKRHYHFIDESSIRMENGIPTALSDYSKLLKQEVVSQPKVWVEDNNPWTTMLYLDGALKFNNIESAVSRKSDKVTQQLLDENVLNADEYADVDSVADLPVVEDVSM